MTERVRERVEAALKLARDPRTIKVDRDAAIAGAERMIERHGLDRSDFRFPEDPRAPDPPPSRFRDDLFARERAPRWGGRFDAEEFADIMRRLQKHMRTAAQRAMDEEGEAIRRRAGDPNSSADAMNTLRAELAVKYLWALDPPIRCYQANDRRPRRWAIPDLGSLLYSDDGVIEVAQAYGWRGEERGDEPLYEYRQPKDLVAERNKAVLNFLRARGLKVTLNDDMRKWTVIHPESGAFFDKHDRDSLYRLARDKGFTG